jgi:hypothetical protein
MIQEPDSATICLGRSVEGREIVAHLRGDGQPGRTLLIGGMHGDEIATVRLLEQFLQADGVARFPLAVVPLANPDGFERCSRYNARGVDLNRNCEYNWHIESPEPPGPGPWSEPESCALRDFIVRWRPEKIVSLHWALAEIDADGEHSTALAEAMWAALDDREKAPYRLRVTELGHGLRRLQQTYVLCPGSLGQWCGYGLEYPDGSRPAMITLELPYDPELARPEELPADHLETLKVRWASDAQGYLRSAWPAVEKMLGAAAAFRE